MGIVISPDSELGKELAKHEQHRTKYVPDELQPGNPYVFRPYPKMLYKAYPRHGGKVVCMEPPPLPHMYATPQQFERAELEVDSFNRSCQCIVATEREHNVKREQGWRETPTEALAMHERLQQDIGNAAAEAAFSARGMSSKAKEELAAADQSTHEHVTDVIGTPKSRRGTDAKKRSHAVAGAAR